MMSLNEVMKFIEVLSKLIQLLLNFSLFLLFSLSKILQDLLENQETNLA